MIVYIPFHAGGAGKWIYQGYFNAWKEKGYEPKYYNNISEIDTNSTYMLMATEGGINQENSTLLNLTLSKASKVFMFTQPHTFPDPWGTHPNFITKASTAFVEMVNSMENVHLWSVAKTSNLLRHFFTIVAPSIPDAPVIRIFLAKSDCFPLGWILFF